MGFIGGCKTKCNHRKFSQWITVRIAFSTLFLICFMSGTDLRADGRTFCIKAASDKPLPNYTEEKVWGSGRIIWVQTDNILDETMIEGAEYDKDQFGSPAILVHLNQEGSDIILEYSRSHIGQMIAISVGGRTLSSPTIVDLLDDKTILIQGQFTKTNIHDWLSVLPKDNSGFFFTILFSVLIVISGFLSWKWREKTKIIFVKNGEVSGMTSTSDGWEKSGGAEFDIVTGVKSRFWRCPHCEVRLEKPNFDMCNSMLSRGVHIQGSATCPKCSETSSQSEVYGGKFDVI